jgi:hypothetical protein
MRNLFWVCGTLAVACATHGCSGGGGTTDAGSPDAANPSDGGGPSDAATGSDAGADAGSADAGGTDAGNLPGCVGTTPLVYDAPTDRLPHFATPPALGDAGSIWNDPTYGTPVLRLTDPGTLPGKNTSFQVANEFGHNDWNTQATLFYVQAPSGGMLLFAFDPPTMTATRVLDKSTGQPLAMPLAGTFFSRTDPNTLYGLSGNTVASFDFTTQTTTSVLDLNGVVPPPTDGGHSYALGVHQGANGLLVSSFGGPEQDAMPYLITYSPATGVQHLMDVTKATLDGVAIPGGPSGTGIHSFQLDGSGQYLMFTVAGASPGNWLWNTSTNAVESLPSAGAIGYGAWIHGGGSPDSLQLSDFASPQDSGSFVSKSPDDSQASSSLSWENSGAGALFPVVADLMRLPGDDAGWAAWDDELIAFRTDGVLNDAGVSDVWRFAHNFNDYDGGQYSDDFYYLFIPRVSQNGWFALFDSNWMKGLGTDSSGNYRTDVFIAKLPNPCGP